MDVLAERLRMQRARCGISQKMVSIKLDVRQSNVSAWENGTKNPTLPMVVKLSEVYGVTIDYLLGKTDTPLSVISENTPYAEVSHFEKTILEAYRALPPAEQTVVCRSLGLTHPAVERAKVKKA